MQRQMVKEDEKISIHLLGLSFPSVWHPYFISEPWRPTPEQMKNRVKSICERENFDISEQDLHKIMTSTGGDLRQVIPLLSGVDDQQGA